MYVQIWRCHDGRRMPINKMDDRHLNNAIAMIYRGHDYMGRVVGRKTARLLPALLVEREIRDLRRYGNPLWG